MSVWPQGWPNSPAVGSTLTTLGTGTVIVSIRSLCVQSGVDAAFSVGCPPTPAVFSPPLPPVAPAAASPAAPAAPTSPVSTGPLPAMLLRTEPPTPALAADAVEPPGPAVLRGGELLCVGAALPASELSAS